MLPELSACSVSIADFQDEFMICVLNSADGIPSLIRLPKLDSARGNRSFVDAPHLVGTYPSVQCSFVVCSMQEFIFVSLSHHLQS